MSETAAPTLTAAQFLADLRAEVASHPAVGHSLLGRCRIDPRSRDDFRLFAGQHYPLVATFTRYLEALLVQAPSAVEKVWLAKVLVDEYGERSAGADHAAHYRVFLRACGMAEGEEERVPLHPAVIAFVDTHLQLSTREPFLVGLGAVGPGHEWAIPAMFHELIVGLGRAGFRSEEIDYFTLHTAQDVDHGTWLAEALATLATTPEAQAQIRRGCRLSLAAREQLWWGIADVVLGGQNRRRFPQLAAAAPAGPTLAELRRRWTLGVHLPES